MDPVPPARLRLLRDLPLRRDGSFVLLAMTAARRVRRNFALARAAALAREAGLPLLVVESLRADYPHAAARFHRFVADGMADQARDLAGSGARYAAALEPRPGAHRGLYTALAAEAAAVVLDDAPGRFHRSLARAVAERARGPVEAVDGAGLLPLADAGRAFPTAHGFRRHLQRTLLPRLAEAPPVDPLRGASLRPLRALPAALRRPGVAETPEGIEEAFRAAEVPATPGPSPVRGGARAAEAALRAFVAERLDGYAEGRNHPDREGASGLSPWLHFGHLSIHDLFAAVARREGWSADRAGRGGSRGAREGWWGMSAPAEALLDQAVTWRELGAAAARFDPEGFDRYAGLPAWARATLAAHRRDRRHPVYPVETLAAAATEDPLWNAAQRQLREEGRMPNYLRMLWGKRVLAWTASPEEAFDALFLLNDRFALDGRDPNSATGISWIFGRYDRPWFPERAIYGTVRYMSTASTLRKIRMKDWLRRWGDGAEREVPLFPSPP